MADSIVKFAHEMSKVKEPGPRFHWGRVQADLDDEPFLGTHAPLYKENEYDQRTVRLYRFENGVFDITNPEQNAKYKEICDRIIGGWYVGIAVSRQFDPDKKLCYIEYAIPYRTSRSPQDDPVTVELNNAN